MNLSADMIEALLAEGMDGEGILRVARAMEKRADPTGAERQARYRTRKRMRSQDWYALREQVFDRDGYECQYCGAKEDLHCDHVVPLIQGGSNEVSNLITACRSCNCAKSGRTPEEWLAE